MVIDYAGPIQMSCSKRHNQGNSSEAVSDLTSEAFVGALNLFFPEKNFTGANKKMDSDFKAAIRNNKTVIPILATQRIRWYFGGISESGVKSVEHQLKRTIG